MTQFPQSRHFKNQVETSNFCIQATFSAKLQVSSLKKPLQTRGTVHPVNVLLYFKRLHFLQTFPTSALNIKLAQTGSNLSIKTGNSEQQDAHLLIYLLIWSHRFSDKFCWLVFKTKFQHQAWIKPTQAEQQVWNSRSSLSHFLSLLSCRNRVRDNPWSLTLFERNQEPTSDSRHIEQLAATADELWWCNYGWGRLECVWFIPF